MMWMFLFVGGLSLFFLASNEAKLLDTTMTLEKNVPLLVTISVLWIGLSVVLIKFDRRAQARAAERYEREMSIFEREHESWLSRMENVVTSKLKGRTKGWSPFGGGPSDGSEPPDKVNEETSDDKEGGT